MTSLDEQLKFQHQPAHTGIPVGSTLVLIGHQSVTLSDLHNLRLRDLIWLRIETQNHPAESSQTIRSELSNSFKIGFQDFNLSGACVHGHIGPGGQQQMPWQLAKSSRIGGFVICGMVKPNGFLNVTSLLLHWKVVPPFSSHRNGDRCRPHSRPRQLYRRRPQQVEWIRTSAPLVCTGRPCPFFICRSMDQSREAKLLS